VAGFENPLMPHARLQQIYAAMVQARTLGRHLAGRRGAVATTGMEACLVSTSVDLVAGDLVSDALAGGVVDYLRGATLPSLLAKPGAKVSKKGATADCGGATRLPAAANFSERMWMALGAAAAAKTMPRAPAEGAAKGMGVVVAYVHRADASGAAWGKVLAYAGAQELPIVFVVLPGTEGASVSVRTRRHGVPGIAVDGDDAVALYRVAQESIGRARAGGGAAVIECAPFVLAGVKRAPVADAIATMEEYMLHRTVVTRAWMDRAASTFAARLAQ
jgi:TPP-dependent pyruvate/acetoin dehydrogenase alpha subunit